MTTNLATKPITAKDVKDYLEQKHNTPFAGTWRGVGFAELSLDDNRGDTNRVDYWAFECWASKAFARTCYEIKVSRSDWLSELKKPLKRRQGMFFSNEFYFIAPKGIVKLEEVPLACGLIEVEWISNQPEIDHWKSQLAMSDKERQWSYRNITEESIPPYREFLIEHKVIKALWRDESFPTWRLVVALCRRLKKLEEVKP